MNNNETQGGLHKSVINWYPGHMAKTKRLISEQINLIDIVYEVIDARMPLSSKIIDIEEYTKNKPKILIVSKTDLCDKKETDKWINYYKEKGFDKKEIIKKIAKDRNVNKNEIYKYFINKSE